MSRRFPPAPWGRTAGAPGFLGRTPTPQPPWDIEFGPVEITLPAYSLRGFRFGDASLPDRHRSVIGDVALRIFHLWRDSRPMSISVSIVGHTDSIGTGAYNRRLGLLRAMVVASELSRRLDVRARRITRVTVRSAGEKRPIASNRTAAGRWRNRRVEVEVSYTVRGAPDE